MVPSTRLLCLGRKALVLEEVRRDREVVSGGCYRSPQGSSSKAEVSKTEMHAWESSLNWKRRLLAISSISLIGRGLMQSFWASQGSAVVGTQALPLFLEAALGRRRVLNTNSITLQTFASEGRAGLNKEILNRVG